MIGIYKITNNINQHCYIGQSRDIQTRWNNEKIASNNKNDKSYNYPLSRAFRKYGIQNFTFSILEECQIEELNEKEHYWIKKLNPEYNQTSGGDYQVHGKLNYSQVQEIQNILIEDKEGKIRHTDLAKQYNVSPDTIQAINAGRAWIDNKLTYPLHLSTYDSRRVKIEKRCIDCNKIISKYSIRCNECENKKRLENSTILQKISREELKRRIRYESFVSIGKDFNVTDNAVRKWCIYYNLPSRKKDIQRYSDKEWVQL